MDFYINLFIITWIVSFLEFFNVKRKFKKILLILMGLVYAFLGGFRWNGIDWNIYYDFFEKNNTLNDFLYGSIPIDKGYGVINFFIKSFTNEYSLVLILSAIFIIIVKIWFINKYTLFPLIGLLYWFCTYFGNIYFLRQDIAISISMIAMYFIIKKKPVIFFVLMTLASTIQISSIFFFPAYWIFHKKFKIKHLCIMLLISILIGRIIDISFLGVLQNIVFFDQERILSKINLYMYDYKWEDIEVLPLLLGYCRRLFFVPLELWIMYKFKKYNNIYMGFINLIIFGNIWYFLLVNMGSTFATRANSMYIVYEIVIIPMIFLFIKSLYIKIVIFILITIYLFMKYIFFIQQNRDAFIPYINILFN